MPSTREPKPLSENTQPTDTNVAADIGPEDIENHEQQELLLLENAFMKAMDVRSAGNNSVAMSMLLSILKKEPRLPEPHLELAQIYLGLQQLHDARTHIDLAVQYLENGGQWLDIDETELLVMAYLTQGEIYRSIADQDSIVFGEPEIYIDLVQRTKNAFQKAVLLDPSAREFSGAIQDWALGSGSIVTETELISESPEIERQPEGQSHRKSPFAPTTEE